MSVSNSGARRRVERPLSPHLQIYTPLINMVMSILHRMTGAGLYFGTLLLAAWLVATAMGPEAYGVVAGLFASLIGKLVLFGFTWALVHHALGGIRHFIWDFGVGYDLDTIDFLSWGTIVASVVLTVVIWAVVILGRGIGVL